MLRAVRVDGAWQLAGCREGSRLECRSPTELVPSKGRLSDGGEAGAGEPGVKCLWYM